MSEKNNTSSINYEPDLADEEWLDMEETDILENEPEDSLEEPISSGDTELKAPQRVKKKKSGSGFLKFLLLVTAAGAGGYYYLGNLSKQDSSPATQDSNIPVVEVKPDSVPLPEQPLQETTDAQNVNNNLGTPEPSIIDTNAPPPLIDSANIQQPEGKQTQDNVANDGDGILTPMPDMSSLAQNSDLPPLIDNTQNDLEGSKQVSKELTKEDTSENPVNDETTNIGSLPNDPLVLPETKGKEDNMLDEGKLLAATETQEKLTTDQPPAVPPSPAASEPISADTMSNRSEQTKDKSIEQPPVKQVESSVVPKKPDLASSQSEAKLPPQKENLEVAANKAEVVVPQDKIDIIKNEVKSDETSSSQTQNTSDSAQQTSPEPIVTDSNEAEEKKPKVEDIKQDKPAATQVKPKESNKETQVKNDEIKPKPERIYKWRLTSAQPGSAVIIDAGTGNMQTVDVGDRVPGIGRVKSIANENGKWVVRGTSGTIRQ